MVADFIPLARRSYFPAPTFCPPTTTYSAYNMINAPKELFVAETTAHYAYAEQWSAAWNWVMNFLKNESRNE